MILVFAAVAISAGGGFYFVYKENRNLKKILKENQRYCDGLQKEKAHMEKEKAALIAEIAEKDKKIDQAAHEIEMQRNQISSYYKTISQKESEIKRKDEEIALLKAENEKLTRPIVGDPSDTVMVESDLRGPQSAEMMPD